MQSVAVQHVGEGMSRRTGIRIARGGVAASGVIAVVASASIAYACTEVMGPLLMAPMSGHAGSTVLTTASGLKPYPARYAIHFGNTSSDDCMSSTGVTILKTIKTNRRGGWSNVPVTIPAMARMGDHGICGMETSPVAGMTGTVHDTFTVV